MSNEQQDHIEANLFALDLMMPPDDFRQTVEGGMDNLGDLAEHYQVSVLAVRHRARTLGFKGHGVGEFKKIRST